MLTGTDIMVRTLDYESRRRMILTATINKYIQDAIPVASEEIARDFDLSSATIRNIFSELEEDGYLTHPYTSAGRIPTNKGYRYYVDFLISQKELLDVEKEQIDREYKNISKKIDRLQNNIEELLDKTSEIVSTITHYVAITSFLDLQDRFFYKGISLVLSQPEFQNYERIRFLIQLIEDKPRLLNVINRDFTDKVKVFIGEELSCPEIDDCALVISSYYLKDRPIGRVAVLGPKRMEYKHTIPTLEYISQVLSETLERF